MAGDIYLTICDLTKNEADAIIEAMHQRGDLKHPNWWMVNGEGVEIDSPYKRETKRVLAKPNYDLIDQAIAYKEKKK